MSVNSIYLLMFTSGLLSGFSHCLGMCGPLVTSYSLGLKERALLPHMLYNLGRVTTYILLGGVVGMTGSFLGVMAGVQGLQRLIMILAGVLIVLMGLGLAGWFPFPGRLEGRGTLFPGFIERALGPSPGRLTAGSFYPLGVLLGFIPCGVVYTALIATARAGMEAENHLFGFLKGLLMMLSFGLGTMPTLLLLGGTVGIMGVRMRSRLQRLSALVMIAAGVIFVARAV